MKSQAFREWLAARLLGMRYATIRLSDDEIDPLAKQLGVDPDLLLEVRAQARVALHEKGLAPPMSNRRNRHLQRVIDDSARLYQYLLWMPPDVFAAWKEECERRGVHGPALLRSLIHEYLLGTHEPQPLKTWVWKGKRLRGYRAHCLKEAAVIPQGAKRALMRRAIGRGTQATLIVRGLVMEALSGGHAGIPLVQAGMMFDDEDRYNMGLPALLDPTGDAQ